MGYILENMCLNFHYFGKYIFVVFIAQGGSPDAYL